MKTILSLVLLLSFSLSSYASCPSNDYVSCSSEGTNCDISGSITQGYISYGAEGRYTLIPFSNTNGNTMRIECDNDHGDVYPGKTKACCYIKASTGFDGTYRGSMSEGGNNGWDFGTSIHSMRYGSNNKHVYRPVAGATGWCSNSFFNDPNPGATKYCQYSSQNPAILDTTEWVECANEGGDCIGLSKSTAHWIRYGDSGDYYYKLVVAGDGKVPCNNDFFEDPVAGARKYCWRSTAHYSFSGATGSWQRVPSCGGCSSSEYTKTIGIEELTSSEMSSTWATSLTSTISADYTFMGIGGSAELSTTVSTSVTNTLTSALTKSHTLEMKYVCEKNSVFQWVTSVTQYGVSVKDFTIAAEDFWCINSGLTPQCPPGYCKDDDCQACTTSLS